jgi:hypothetical protein
MIKLITCNLLEKEELKVYYSLEHTFFQICSLAFMLNYFWFKPCGSVASQFALISSSYNKMYFLTCVRFVQDISPS